MIIRELTIEDLPPMAELYCDVFTREPWNEEWEVSGAQERLDLYLTGKNAIGLGCFENDTLRGMVLGEHAPYQKRRDFFIKELCVAPSNQGTGIGRALWSELEIEVKKIGVDSLVLLTEKGTPAEERYYRKMGCVSSEKMILMYKEL